MRQTKRQRGNFASCRQRRRHHCPPRKFLKTNPHYKVQSTGFGVGDQPPPPPLTRHILPHCFRLLLPAQVMVFQAGSCTKANKRRLAVT